MHPRRASGRWRRPGRARTATSSVVVALLVADLLAVLTLGGGRAPARRLGAATRPARAAPEAPGRSSGDPAQSATGTGVGELLPRTGLTELGGQPLGAPPAPEATAETPTGGGAAVPGPDLGPGHNVTSVGGITSIDGARATTQGCGGPPADTGASTIGWNELRNPILSYPRSAIRDIGIRLVHGRWNLYFTSAAGQAPTWSIATSTSADWRAWTFPVGLPPQAGVSGVASPDVTRGLDESYVMTYQSDPGQTDPPGQSKLYYRLSNDMGSWSAPRRLMADVHGAPSDRLIDPALAWTAHGLFLGYKYGANTQHFEIAWSPSSSLAGPWVLVGRPDITVYGDTIENYQFLPVDGVWNLLATSNNLNRPWLFTLTGNPRDPHGWLQWSSGRELEVPAEAWNRAPGVPSVTFDQADAAYLCDARGVDGHFYLLYVGTNDMHGYGGFGHTSLGVARSADLVTWQVPCGPTGVSTPTGCATR